MTKPGIVENDPWLEPHQPKIEDRINKWQAKEQQLLQNAASLKEFASGHLYFGLHKTSEGWVIRELAPNATAIYLVGECNHWRISDDFKFTSLPNGVWELKLPQSALLHGQKYKLHITWEGGEGDRIPAYTTRVIQNPDNHIFDAVVWASDEPYQWKNKAPDISTYPPIIYEAHVGMATENEGVGTYNEFREKILPRIHKAGYNTIQLMAIQEHPYYGSFGYHVSNFFAVSSRFGTPYELKQLVDEAHGLGIAVIMDIVHSHSVKNELEGLGKFDGTGHLYFHEGPRREHIAWDSLCFDYGKIEVLHFLLSNCRYWLEEFNFDGFRFDGITSMLYFDHGLGRDFNSYDFYFDGGQDDDAITYITLANKLIQEVKPGAIAIAEDMSGMPGLAAPIADGGMGFHFRLSMGIPDFWIKLIKEATDDTWPMGGIFHELTTRRADERTISYAESHDQALVGDKTIIFRLIDQEMYWHMDKKSENLVIDRGMALHKMIRLVTLSTASGGYLNFMGNEFGHPEWIDFPREGNNWSYKYARRQWSLADNRELRYHWLADFDRDMLNLINVENILQQEWCNHVVSNEGDKILAYERKGLLFVFNFHPTHSYTDYGIAVQPGKYRIYLNTDSNIYGGFGHIDESITYYTEKPGKPASLQPHYIKLYLPSRTALVLKHMPSKSVY
ncbi:MAG: 1,4-alpha-glucan-branching enzyme [Bacteroidetes bacterium]|nr:1,4-alpha-glucan-branching enzyme [Bacteroidota bacterium]